MNRCRLLLLVLATAVVPASRAAAVPLPGEWTFFLSGVAPAARPATVAPGLDLDVRPGPGAGVAATFFEPHDLATLVAFDVSRLPLRLNGPGGSGESGGQIDFAPLSILEELRFAPDRRVRPYVGAGIIVPFLLGTNLSDALRQAGIAAVRRPDHPALLVGLGADFTLGEHAVLAVDLRWVPYAETLVLVPRGEQFKSQELMRDFNPVTVAVGVAWRR